MYILALEDPSKSSFTDIDPTCKIDITPMGHFKSSVSSSSFSTFPAMLDDQPGLQGKVGRPPPRPPPPPPPPPPDLHSLSCRSVALLGASGCPRTILNQMRFFNSSTVLILIAFCPLAKARLEKAISLNLYTRPQHFQYTFGRTSKLFILSHLFYLQEKLVFK